MRRILLAILLLGCASNPRPSSTAARGADRVLATDETVGMTIRSPNDAGPAGVALSAPVDSVMKAVALSFAFLKIPITYSNPATGEQGNKGFVVSRRFDGRPISDYFNCGDDPFRGPNADAHPVTISILTRARQVDANKTALETELSGFTTKPGSSTAIYCSSLGYLEHHLAEMVESRINH